MDEPAVSNRPNTPLPPTETVTPDIFKQSTYNTSDFPPSQPQTTEQQTSITPSVSPILEKLAKIKNASNTMLNTPQPQEGGIVTSSPLVSETPTIVEPNNSNQFSNENGQSKEDFNQAVETKMKQDEAYKKALEQLKNGVSPDRILVQSDPQKRSLADIIGDYYDLLTIKALRSDVTNDRLINARDKYIKSILEKELGEEYDYRTSIIVKTRTDFLSSKK